jgi:hypothetical protein
MVPPFSFAGVAVILARCATLYSITKGQKAIRDLAKTMVDHARNMPSVPAIFPDQMAPVVMTRRPKI